MVTFTQNSRAPLNEFGCSQMRVIEVTRICEQPLYACKY